MSPQPRMAFADLFPPINGRRVSPPSYLNRPGPPSVLYWTPCREADPVLFDPLPSYQSLEPGEPREDRQRGIAYAARYCNGTQLRPACAFREKCLSWALEAKERVVAGGVEVTQAMIDRYHKAKKEASRAAAETEPSPDGRGQLAEQRREAGRGEPARPEAEGAA